MDLILKPVRRATSKPALSAYLNTILFATISLILLGFAVVSYFVFYYNYVPQIGIEKIIHLQFGDGPHPYGIAALDSSLISQQAYDIALSLNVPRSPPNLAQGNFMLSLSLLSPTYRPPLPPSTAPQGTLTTGPTASLSPDDILFFSRRPAILTYTSHLVSFSERFLSLPFYVSGLRRESETLSVPMAESATFPKGWKNIPGYVLLELQAGQEVQVYDVKIQFTARFGGLRWLMYHYWITSFVAFTGAFWGFEVLFAGLGWLAVRNIFAGTEVVKEEVKEEEGTEGTETIKNEDDDLEEPDLSDTPRTFPTYGRQPPLRYVPKVKEEDTEEVTLDETTIQPLAAEADDEDEEGDHPGTRGGRTDSGIGTSFSETGGGSGLARRRSKGKGPG